jgi:F-type H+-transporting ATPase subunit epsilon
MLHFELVTPEKLLRSEEVYQVVVPGTEGDFGVLEGHAPFMSTIRDGNLAIYRADKSEPELVPIKGGFAEVSATGLTVLAEQAGYGWALVNSRRYYPPGDAPGRSRVARTDEPVRAPALQAVDGRLCRGAPSLSWNLAASAKAGAFIVADPKLLEIPAFAGMTRKTSAAELTPIMPAKRLGPVHQAGFRRQVHAFAPIADTLRIIVLRIGEDDLARSRRYCRKSDPRRALG